MTQRTKTSLITIALAAVIGASVCLMAEAERADRAPEVSREAVVEVVSNRTYESIGSIDEAMFIAKLIEATAPNEDSYSRRLIADTVLNRVADPAFPDTVAQVIEQDGQFVQLEDLYGIDVSRDSDAYIIASEELIDQVDYEVKFFDCNGYVADTVPKLHTGSLYFSE